LTKYGMVIEANRCIGCDLCLKACKDEYEGNDHLPYSAAQPAASYGYTPSDWPAQSSTLQLHVEHGHKWMADGEVTKGSFPKLKTRFVYQPCMHCENAPCQKAATSGAIYTRSDGIVLIDPTASVGQRQLVAACPYGRIYWNADSNIPQKCTFCAHIVVEGGLPRCVEACPLSVLTFGDLDDPSSDVSKKFSSTKAEVLHPEFQAEPKVYYFGLPKPFMTGKVIDSVTKEFVNGATLKLTAEGDTIANSTTDNYGDFEFGNLRTGRMYSIEVTKAGMYSKKIMIYLDTEKDIGKVPLSKRIS
jgi:tetrathionate reductase subunit B